jgi:hypothetical protein
MRQIDPPRWLGQQTESLIQQNIPSRSQQLNTDYPFLLHMYMPTLTLDSGASNRSTLRWKPPSLLEAMQLAEGGMGLWYSMTYTYC